MIGKLNHVAIAVPDLEQHLIAGCGHWTQQEKPEELNRILSEWLRRRF